MSRWICKYIPPFVDNLRKYCAWLRESCASGWEIRKIRVERILRSSFVWNFFPSSVGGNEWKKGRKNRNLVHFPIEWEEVTYLLVSAKPIAIRIDSTPFFLNFYRDIPHSNIIARIVQQKLKNPTSKLFKVHKIACTPFSVTRRRCLFNFAITSFMILLWKAKIVVLEIWIVSKNITVWNN